MKKRSVQQEKRFADRHGGKVTPGSGNTWSRKNDIRTEDLSIELKFTDKKSYSLKSSELTAAEKHALLDGRSMLFGVEMQGRTWIVMSEEDFLDLHRRANGSEA